MPNNFKIIGNYYVSKAGNDANSGLTPDAPKLTFSSGLSALPNAGGNFLIVGSGVYLESGIRRIDNSSTTNYRVIGDGKVVLDGGGYGILTFSRTGNSSAGNAYYNNLEFNNYSDLIFDFVSSPIGLQYTFTNCVFKNCKFSNYNTNTSSGNNLYFVNCTFINCKIETISSNPAIRAAVYLYNSILINSQTYFTIASGVVDYQAATATCLNCYIDKNSIVNFTTALVVAASSFNFNNIQGKIVMYQNGAVSGPNSFGVALSFAQHRIDYPTYNVNSISADPLFNNPRLLDFTLQAGSPNVSASSDYSSNIGGTEYAVSYTASSAAFTTNATSQSLDYRGLYYGISGSAVSGSITSGPMFLQWPRTKPLTSVNWMGALDFNKTISASFAGNTNVPAYTTYTSASGEAGANPDRLKIAMRFSTQQTQPSTDAEWDNNGYWTAGTYQLFEPNTKPKVDYKGTGNGDPTYVETSAIGDLVPSWIQTEIILRNDYNR